MRYINLYVEILRWHEHGMLHQRSLYTKFTQNRSMHGGVNDVISIFQHGGRQPCWISFVILDHPRRAIVDLSLVCKFGVDRI